MIDEETILTLSLDAAWTLYKIKFLDMSRTKDEDGNKVKPFTTTQDYDNIRFGLNIKFEIDDYLKNRFREKPKSGTIVIWKDEYNISDFRTEIDNRERMIRSALLDYYAQENDIISMKR